MRHDKLIDKYYAAHPEAGAVLRQHSGQVAGLATRIARDLHQSIPVDVDFVAEAAWLHDIGMFMTAVSQFGCTGDAPYICHGLIGAELLRTEGLDRHALVCERHIGVGLTVEDIQLQQLPLPLRDMSPQTLEERIVTYADLFYSKSHPGRKSLEEVRRAVGKHGTHRLVIFEQWHKQFTQLQNQE